MGKIIEATVEIQKLSEHKNIRDAAVAKFHKLQKESKIHHFKDEDAKDHIANWKVVHFAEEKVAYGVNYFMKVLIDPANGHTIHIRVHRQVHHDVYDFYSLHQSILHNSVTYVWPLNEPIRYFNV